MYHKLLNELGACQSGKEFAEKHPTLKAAWNACNEPAWMIWFLQKTNQITKEQSVQLAIFSAEQVISLYEAKHPDEKRPRQAIEAAKKWLAEPNEENRKAAAAAAATYFDATYFDAAYAADADNAAYAAAYAADAAAAAYAAYAAYAAAYAADDAAAAAAARKKIKQCVSNFIRSLFVDVKF